MVKQGTELDKSADPLNIVGMSNQNMSMMHFDEQSFIKSLLTNDRVNAPPSYNTNAF